MNILFVDWENFKNKLKQVFNKEKLTDNVNWNNKGKEILIFREKGVDVQIAIDMVKTAFKDELKIAILASSDSDLQPAVKELKEIRELKQKGIEIIYLGFEMDHNKGLGYTTDRTILIRNSEVLEFFPQKLDIQIYEKY